MILLGALLAVSLLINWLQFLEMRSLQTKVDRALCMAIEWRLKTPKDPK